jgi:hypothetical protein
MYYASKELCQELYELSNWEDVDWSYDENGHGFTFRHQANSIPAYDLGYLLRKLPKTGQDNVFATVSVFVLTPQRAGQRYGNLITVSHMPMVLAHPKTPYANSVSSYSAKTS